jgi:hypothetical protein
MPAEVEYISEHLTAPARYAELSHKHLFVGSPRMHSALLLHLESSCRLLGIVRDNDSTKALARRRLHVGGVESDTQRFVEL